MRIYGDDNISRTNYAFSNRPPLGKGAAVIESAINYFDSAYNSDLAQGAIDATKFCAKGTYKVFCFCMNNKTFTFVVGVGTASALFGKEPVIAVASNIVNSFGQVFGFLVKKSAEVGYEILKEQAKEKANEIQTTIVGFGAPIAEIGHTIGTAVKEGGQSVVSPILESGHSVVTTIQAFGSTVLEQGQAIVVTAVQKKDELMPVLPNMPKVPTEQIISTYNLVSSNFWGMAAKTANAFGSVKERVFGQAAEAVAKDTCGPVFYNASDLILEKIWK